MSEAEQKEIEEIEERYIALVSEIEERSEEEIRKELDTTKAQFFQWAGTHSKAIHSLFIQLWKIKLISLSDHICIGMLVEQLHEKFDDFDEQMGEAIMKLGKLISGGKPDDKEKKKTSLPAQYV